MANSSEQFSMVAKIVGDEDDDYDDYDDFGDDVLQSDELRIVSASTSIEVSESDHHDTTLCKKLCFLTFCA